MGLGKTVQYIAFLLGARMPRDERRPALLVCPTSVIGNWRRELQRFAPDLEVAVHHGTDRDLGPRFVERVQQRDLVLTTYSLLDRDESTLRLVNWAGVVLDEAQNVKNPATRRARAARALKGGYRFAMTGTPVENRLSELWAILDFLNPGYLGSRESFRRSFAVPIERWRDGARAADLRRLVGPFVLRRVKTDPHVIQDLPDKFEARVYCTLTREQAALYQAVVDDMLRSIDQVEGIERRGRVLAALLRLKQVCNHPASFLGDADARPLGGRSGKLARLEEMLEEVIDEDEAALVFTQFSEFGGRLREYLQSRLGREILFLHGGTPARTRDTMVTRFQRVDGPPVFLLSLKAGGTGLNLTRATHVFHFDRWWNPAVEDQATDRAFRIGQARNVQVHKYICAGTLEEKIDALIESKQALAEQVIGAGESWLTELSNAELRDLLALRSEAVMDD
jgi:SNF2 family DNA or RNA helicase